ncbi:MAG: hypothetical protein KatS3mg011_2054 [Acidimicrobiia bacterium]|nr:MAG: hypothetical protein KatS3mg011_2054 [Acidimicrobiia bacterium]
MQTLSSHNPLILILALVTAAGAAGAAYLGVYVARGKDGPEVRKQFGALFFLIGLFALGGFAQLVLTDWAGFPAGHYSELFGVSTGLFSFLLIVAGFLLYNDMSLAPLSWASALIGLYLLQGARAVLAFDLTRNPPLTFLMWLAAGLAALGMLPYAYVGEETRRRLAWAGVVVLGLMTVAAAVTGIAGFYGHIEEIVAQG